MMNESFIQNALYSWLENKKHILITPNVGLFGRYESDLVSVTAAGLINEFEIKVSRSDYMAEFRRKKRKTRLPFSGERLQAIHAKLFPFCFSRKRILQMERPGGPELFRGLF